MSGYINRDFLERRIHETMDMQDLYLPIHFIQLMNELDDADVVEVVRCKYCRFWETITDRAKAEYGICAVFKAFVTTHKEYFCACGSLMDEVTE